MKLVGKAHVVWDGAEAKCNECGMDVVLEMKDRPVDVTSKGIGGGVGRKQYTFTCPTCGQHEIMLNVDRRAV